MLRPVAAVSSSSRNGSIESCPACSTTCSITICGGGECRAESETDNGKAGFSAELGSKPLVELRTTSEDNEREEVNENGCELC